MAQNYTIDMFAPGNQVQIDMQNIEHNLECLRSQFFGLTAPANPLAGMPWYGAGGKDALRVRNADNTAWLAVLLGDAGHKTWVYRNEATPGWVVDDTVADVVLAVKGGTQAYNVSGGGQTGAWAISGLTIGSHTHGITADANHRHDIGSIKNPNTSTTGLGAGANYKNDGGFWENYAYYSSYAGSHSHGAATQAATPTISHAGTWRPSAAVGTLQYPDLT